MATSIGFDIFAKDDRASSTFLKVAASAKLLNSTVDDLRTNFLGLGKLVGGTSVIPVIAAAGGALTELTVSAAAGAGALGVLGLSVGGTFAQMIKANTTINATTKSLALLAPGTAAYKLKLQELHDQQKAFNTDFGKAGPAFDKMKGSWLSFLHATGPASTGLLANGFGLISSVLPKLVPVSNAAAKAVGGLLGELTTWTKGPEFKAVLKWLETSGPNAITAFGHTIGHTIHGLAGILGNFVGPGDHAARTMAHLSANFDKWGNSKGVSDSVNSFLHYMSSNGPNITTTLESLAKSAPKIADAMGKLGSANLSVASRFLNMVAGLPQGAFNAIADGLFAIAAGSKAIAIGKGIGALGALGKDFIGGRGSSGGGGGISGALGVQKVYVVNMGPGGMGGGGGEPVPGGGWGSRFGKYFGFGAGAGAEGATGATSVSAAAVAALAVPAAAIVYAGFIQRNIHPYGTSAAASADPGVARGGRAAQSYYGATPAPSAPRSYGRGIVVHDAVTGYGAATAGLKSMATQLDVVRARAAKASQGLDIIGPHAEQASHKSVAAIHALIGANGLDSINTRAIKASQGLDLIGPHAQDASGAAVRAIHTIPVALAGIHDKSFKINADTSLAMANIQLMQRQEDALHNKTIIIRSIGGHFASDTAGGGGITGGSGGGASRGGGGGGRSAAAIVLGGYRNIRSGAAVGNVLSRIQSGVQNAHGRLQSAIANRNGFASGFQNFATSIFGANYGTDATTGAAIPPTIASILAMQQAQATQAHTVRLNVKSLIKKGLSPALLKQMQAAGQAGMEEISALASATPAQIAQLNSLNKATSGDLKAAGMSAANRLYGAQIKQDREHYNQEHRVLKEIRDLLKHDNTGGQRVVKLKLEGNDLVALLDKTKRTTGRSPK